MSWPSVKNNLWLACVILCLGWLWWYQHHGEQAVADPNTGFTTLTKARLETAKDNDGDSFHVRVDGLVYHFRLYFVDAPEKRRFPLNEKRIRDQGRYFDGLDLEKTVKLGQAARDHALRLLSAGTFTVHTRWKEVFDSDRHYAFVTLSDGQDLGENLVRHGLARLHTEGADHPDGRDAAEVMRQLRAAEREAKAKGEGGWKR